MSKVVFVTVNSRGRFEKLFHAFVLLHSVVLWKPHEVLSLAIFYFIMNIVIVPIREICFYIFSFFRGPIEVFPLGLFGAHSVSYAFSS